MICIYNNEEHNGRLIDRETIVVRTYPVRWNAPNRRAVVQPCVQISKLQTYGHTSSQRIQACRPTGVKNYMLTDVFFFFCFCFFPFFFPSLFLSYSFFFFFFGNQTHKVTAAQDKHRTVQNLLPFFFFNETQA